MKRTILVAAMASALCAVPLSAIAAGMGKITVLSALGQPLRAELDITASREELATLVARVAPVEAFRQANVEYASVLPSVRFTLDKRPDGKPYFKIQTDRAVNDPFIDFLVELSWSSGRLVREYAFLLDPPELKIDNAPVAAMAPATSASTVESTAPVTQSEAGLVQEKRVRPAPVESRKLKEVGDDSPGAEVVANTRKVKAGDTLGKIAAESVTAGVTLDQMLVALFNGNRDAFTGGNMNRLHAGKILNIPDVETAAALSAREARKIVVVQSTAFNEYRRSLAAAVTDQTPVEQKPQQSSSGKIAAKVEEKSPPTSGQDKLQVSRSEAQAKADKGKLSEEDIVVRDKALKEANSRIGELEKNLSDLKKLAELKSQSVVDAQKVAPAPEMPVTAVAVNPPATPTPAETGIAVAGSTPVAVPAGEKPQPKPKKIIIPPPPQPEPGFVESNPLLVYGGGVAIAAILGFLGFRTWKRRRDSDDGDIDRDQGITASELATNSVFGMAASESATLTAAVEPDFGRTTADDAVDSEKEGIDPIQEAEVYMAYGRDGQAEEILVDAMQKTPGNLVVYLKLLEIYAGRKSLPQFNEVAKELHTRTAGRGSEWEKAVALGYSLDPGNPLYSAAASPEPVQIEQMAAINAAPVEHSLDATMVMGTPPLQDAPAPVELAPATVEEVSNTLDFDFDLVAEASPAPAEPAGTAEMAVSSGLDFDLAAPAATGTTIAPATETDGEFGLDFDFDLGESASAALEQSLPPLDLSSISLDLDDTAAFAAIGKTEDSPEVATKLELAQAYEEMGDREGARELLQEVLAEGSSAQQEVARNKLSQLG